MERPVRDDAIDASGHLAFRLGRVACYRVMVWISHEIYSVIGRGHGMH